MKLNRCARAQLTMLAYEDYGASGRCYDVDAPLSVQFYDSVTGDSNPLKCCPPAFSPHPHPQLTTRSPTVSMCPWASTLFFSPTACGSMTMSRKT